MVIPTPHLLVSLLLAFPLVSLAHSPNHHGKNPHLVPLRRRSKSLLPNLPTSILNSPSSSSSRRVKPPSSTRAGASSPFATSSASVGSGAEAGGPGIAAAAVATVPLQSFAPGATPPVRGAPPLPDLSTIDPSNYPMLDRIPPLDSAQMQSWISSIDMTQIPDIPPNGMGGCANVTANAQAIANAGSSGNCWWTCGHCTRPADITFCPNKNSWGLSYDDGPSPSTPTLLSYLQQKSLLATFFVVGSRAISRPEVLQATYMAGHQISGHTWSHPYLTTLSNEAIIAELAWSKAVIKAITGVTPNTLRPPYGDIDDRVRYISLALGLTPIIWTTTPAGISYDTQDWSMADGGVSEADVLKNFDNIFNNSTSLDTGFIVLEHDLDSQSVNLAVNHVLPQALTFQPPLTLQPIITCMGQDSSMAYFETSNAASGPAPPVRAVSTNLSYTALPPSLPLSPVLPSTTNVGSTSTSSSTRILSISSSSSSSSSNSASTVSATVKPTLRSNAEKLGRGGWESALVVLFFACL